jgi:hypothetical protein
MSNPVKLYHREMHEKIGFFANWLPGDPIEIGAIGVLVDGRFRQESSLVELQIPFNESAPGYPQDLRYTSSSGVKVSTSAEGSIAATASAEVSIEFSEEGAFIFQAAGLRARQLDNRSTVTRGVLEADRDDRWQRNWVLVEALHIAECATIIVSESNGAGLVLAAEAGTLISAAALADPKLGLRVRSSSGRLVQVICGRKLRPLYRCVRLSGGWLPGTTKKLEPRTGSSLTGVEIRELLAS